MDNFIVDGNTNIAGVSAIIQKCTGSSGIPDELTGDLVKLPGAHSGMGVPDDFISHLGGETGGNPDSGNLFRGLDNAISRHGIFS